MEAHFAIEVDVARSLVRTTLSGFFTDEAIARYLVAREIAFARLRCGPNQHLSLTDVRAMAIQAQDVVGRWGTILANPAYRSRRLAFVVASTLTRKQVQRAIGSRDAQVFTDMSKAEQWVLEAALAERAA